MRIPAGSYQKKGIEDICPGPSSIGPQLYKRKNNTPLIFSKNAQMTWCKNLFSISSIQKISLYLTSQLISKSFVMQRFL